MPCRKSFFAASIEAALAMARKELGEDTLLVQSRATGPEQRHLGLYEVVVESDAGGAPSEAPRWDELLGQVSRMRDDLHRMSELMFRASPLHGPGTHHPLLADAASHMMAAEFPSAIVSDVLDEAASILISSPDTSPAIAVRRALAGRLLAAPPGSRGARQVLALIGPPGAGKTTTLVKLAVRNGLAAGRPALLIASDTCRVYAAEQLQSYAGTLGLPCVIADNPAVLARTLEEHSRKELVLIDTPGFGPADRALALEWRRLLQAHPDISPHLVLPATMRFSDLRRAMEDWAMFRPEYLILTRLDETTSLGPALSAAIAAEKPLSYVTFGQSVPEDLLPAAVEQLVEQALGESKREREAA